MIIYVIMKESTSVIIGWKHNQNKIQLEKIHINHDQTPGDHNATIIQNKNETLAPLETCQQMKNIITYS